MLRAWMRPARSPSLPRLFDPRAVAVVGATETPGKIGRIILEMLAHCGRPLHPVHPTASEVLGRTAYSSVAALPDDVDLAVIALGAEKAVPAAEQCGERGIPFIIPVAGGFGEAGAEGRALEDRLTAIRERHDSRILGPNTLGIYLPHEKIDTIFVDHPTARWPPAAGLPSSPRAARSAPRRSPLPPISVSGCAPSSASATSAIWTK